MDTLTKLLEALAPFSPELLKLGKGRVVRCRRLGDREENETGEEVPTVYITDSLSKARKGATKKENAVFFLGDRQQGLSLNGCEGSVVLFPAGTSSLDLEEATKRWLRRCYWYQEARRELERVFLQGGGLQNLIEKLEEQLELPVALFDRGAMPLAIGSRFRDLNRDAIHSEYQEKGYISFQFAQKNSFRQFTEALEKNGTAFTYRYAEESNHPRRVRKILMSGEFVAHCSVVLLRELRPGEDELLAYLAELVRVELERTAYDREHNTPVTLLLRSLLRGNYRTEGAFQEAAKLSGFQRERYLFVLNFSRKREGGSNPVNGMFPMPLLREILAHLPPQLHAPRYLVEPGRILFLLDTNRLELMEQWREHFARFAWEGRHLCALSGPFEHILEMKEQTERTERLKKVGEFAGISYGLLDDRGLFFEKLAYGLHITGQEKELLSSLEALQREASAGERNLMETAYEYLQQGHCAATTAKVLGVHRNTLLRRLERFRELTGLDLDNGEDACKVYVACRLMAVEWNPEKENDGG